MRTAAKKFVVSPLFIVCVGEALVFQLGLITARYVIISVM
jgi:hypothetical protein